MKKPTLLLHSLTPTPPENSCFLCFKIYFSLTYSESQADGWHIKRMHPAGPGPDHRHRNHAGPAMYGTYDVWILYTKRNDDKKILSLKEMRTGNNLWLAHSMNLPHAKLINRTNQLVNFIEKKLKIISWNMNHGNCEIQISTMHIVINT